MQVRSPHGTHLFATHTNAHTGTQGRGWPWRAPVERLAAEGVASCQHPVHCSIIDHKGKLATQIAQRAQRGLRHVFRHKLLEAAPSPSTPSALLTVCKFHTVPTTHKLCSSLAADLQLVMHRVVSCIAECALPPARHMEALRAPIQGKICGYALETMCGVAAAELAEWQQVLYGKRHEASVFLGD